MVKICIVAGALQWVLATEAFTLAWNHSIEKVRWEEDYRLEGGALVLSEARIRGSAAGMEPPPDAVRRNGVWHYMPANNRYPRLTLANSRFGGHYEICTADGCRALPVQDDDARSGTVIAPCAPDRNE